MLYYLQCNGTGIMSFIYIYSNHRFSFHFKNWTSLMIILKILDRILLFSSRPRFPILLWKLRAKTKKSIIFTPVVFQFCFQNLEQKPKNKFIFFRLTVFPFLLSKLRAKTKNNLENHLILSYYYMRWGYAKKAREIFW